MDIKNLKIYLCNNVDKIQFILEELGFHHIKIHKGNPDNYIKCGNFNGDNQSAITIYLNEILLTENYTRDICSSKEHCDFIDLVMYARNQIEIDNNFFLTLKWIAEKSDLNYYHSFEDKEPEYLKTLKLLQNMLKKTDNNDEDDIPLKPKDEVILSYYFPWVNDMFLEDSVDYKTQRLFEIGYDCATNYITIPVRSEIGDLIGVKGRYASREVAEGIQKFYYLEQCNKSKVLYGYYLTKDFIKKENRVFVFEAEKSVQVMWSNGYKNSVATMGKKISKYQIEKLNRLDCDIVFAFDQDVRLEELEKIAENFCYGKKIYALYDKNKKIMKEKMSPCDDMGIFKYMLENCLIELK